MTKKKSLGKKEIWHCNQDKHCCPRFNKVIRNTVEEIKQPKTGHWIDHPHEAGINWEFSRYECSECHAWADYDSDYCPNCGVKMVEPQESEE